jgi:hypothetical protein
MFWSHSHFLPYIKGALSLTLQKAGIWVNEVTLVGLQRILRLDIHIGGDQLVINI